MAFKWGEDTLDLYIKWSTIYRSALHEVRLKTWGSQIRWQS